MTFFKVVGPCSVIEVYRRFRGVHCLFDTDDEHPDDGGTRYP
jgi:hypothetical protein